MRILAAVGAALLVGTAAAQPALERELQSQNPAELRATFERIKRDAGRTDPLYLMLMAGKMQQLGQHDEALFWFLAGQLRMRYVLAVSPDETRGQASASITAALGMAIYPRYEFKEEQIAAAIDRVLAWDRNTPIDLSWLKAGGVPPQAEWTQKFEPVRQGMLKLKAEFLALPKDECARIAKSMGSIDFAKEREELQASWNSESNRKRVESGFSTAPVTVTAGGIAFRTAKNYLSPFGTGDSVDYKDREIGFHVFLPGLSGYSRENWSERLHPQKLQVNVLPGSKFSFMQTYGEQAAKAGVPLRVTNGLRVYASPSAHKCFPEELLTGTQADGEPVYGSCVNLKTPYPSCSVYFYGPARAYQLSVGLKPEQLPQWRELVGRMKTLVASWQDAARSLR
jgi:hypothetical protein